LADQTGVYGILYGHSGGGQLIAQIAGVATIGIVMFSIVFAFFKIQNALTKGGIRPTAEVELQGVDIPEMGVLAYPDFYGSSPHVEIGLGNGTTSPLGEPVPVGQDRSR
jgi:Amt family ammonium transporter